MFLENSEVKMILVVFLGIAGLIVGIAGAPERHNRMSTIFAVISVATWVLLTVSVQINSDRLQQGCRPNDTRCFELADMDRFMIPMALLIGWLLALLLGHVIRFTVRKTRRPTVGSSHKSTTDQVAWPERPHWAPRKRQ